jgi:small subunit ribosomal protein S20
LAHGKSAKKRVRQSAARRLRNRQAKSALRTTVKKLTAAISAGDAAAATAALRGVQKKLDQAASKGLMRKGTAARMKSRLAGTVATKVKAKK